MAQSLLWGCSEEADQGFPEAGGFTPKIAFYHMVDKSVLTVGEKFQFFLLWVSPQAVWTLTRPGSSFPSEQTTWERPSNRIGTLNRSPRTQTSQFHHNQCIGNEVLSWPTLEGKRITLHLLKGGVSKNLQTRFIFVYEFKIFLYIFIFQDTVANNTVLFQNSVVIYS